MDADRTAALAALEGADRAQMLDHYMCLNGAALADRREAERYLAYVLDGPDREACPPLPSVAYPAPAAPTPVAWRAKTPDGSRWCYHEADPTPYLNRGREVQPLFAAPAAPAPAVEEMASLDVMAERLRAWLVANAGRCLPASLTSRGIAHILTGLPPGPERDAALSAVLARLGAEPPADPARATLDGAVREAAQAAHDVLCKVLSHSVDRHEGMTLMRDARDGIRAALAAEPDAGDGWRPIETADPNKLAWLYAPPENLSRRPDQQHDIRVARPRDWCWATLWAPINAHPAPPAPRTGREG